MENKTSDKLSRKNLIGYGLGAIPAGLFMYVFNLKYIELFYDDLLLLPIYFIIGQVIYMTVNALNDPLLGQLSDRTNREKWGSRRLIYIKYGAPLWAVAFLLVWFPWSYTDQIIIFIHFTISICLNDTIFTLVVLAWMSLLPEMTSNIDERNKANFISLLIGAIAVVPFLLILGAMDATSIEFQIIVIIVAIISTAFALLTAYMCEEKPEYRKDESFPLWKSIKETVKLKSFLLFIGYNFCGILIGSVGLSYLFAYMFILGLNSTMVTVIYFLIFIFVGYSAYIVCMKLRPKWGMRKIILRFGILRAIGGVIIFIFALIPGSELLLWIGFAWLTFFAGYGIFTTGSLMALSMDEDEVNQETRREGMFLGINALFTKPAASIGPVIATLIFLAFGFVQGADTQSAEALIGIKILFLLVPAILAAISLIFIYFYPWHGEKLEEMRKKLEEIHKKKLESVR